jgi:hypothetical protein
MIASLKNTLNNPPTHANISPMEEKDGAAQGSDLARGMDAAHGNANISEDLRADEPEDGRKKSEAVGQRNEEVPSEEEIELEKKMLQKLIDDIDAMADRIKKSAPSAELADDILSELYTGKKNN